MLGNKIKTEYPVQFINLNYLNNKYEDIVVQTDLNKIEVENIILNALTSDLNLKSVFVNFKSLKETNGLTEGLLLIEYATLTSVTIKNTLTFLNSKTETLMLDEEQHVYITKIDKNEVTFVFDSNKLNRSVQFTVSGYVKITQ